jgi:hypothetical protein
MLDSGVQDDKRATTNHEVRKPLRYANPLFITEIHPSFPCLVRCDAKHWGQSVGAAHLTLACKCRTWVPTREAADAVRRSRPSCWPILWGE